MRSQANSAAKGSASLIFAFFFMAVVNYTFSIVMSWLLSSAAYGMLGVAQTILLLAGMLTWSGFPWVAARSLSANLGAVTEGYRVFKSSLVGNLALGILFGAILFVGFERSLLRLGEDYRPIIAWIVVTGMLLALSAIFRGALQGLFRFTALAITQGAEVVVKFLCGLLLVLLGFGVTGAIAGFALGALFSTILAFLFSRDFRFWSERAWGDPHVYASAVPMFMGVFSLTLIRNLDFLGLKFFTSAALSDTLCGYYQPASILAGTPVFVAAAMMSAIFSYIARASQELPNAQGYIRKALKYALLFLVPAALTLAIIPEPIIRLFFPATYRISSGALVISAIGAALLIPVTVITTAVQALGRLKEPALVLSLAVIVEVIALSILVPRYALLGAPAALSLAALFA
jgi:O-antigen/teichoic acid export membrane protein